MINISYRSEQMTDFKSFKKDSFLIVQLTPNKILETFQEIHEENVNSFLSAKLNEWINFTEISNGGQKKTSWSSGKLCGQQ